MTLSRLLAVVLIFLTSSLYAATLTGRVIGVSDGDTITILDADKVQTKIRLSGIDAPEKNQPYGQQSKQSLSDLIYDKAVLVEYEKEDRYGRTVGKILLNGQDINLEQIRRGLAWHYKKYMNEQPLDDRLAYTREEEAAKASRKGLWQDKSAIPPWDWRHRKSP